MAVAVVVTGLALLLGAVAWVGYRSTVVLAGVDRAQEEVRLAAAAYQQRDLAAGADHLGAATDKLQTARRASSDPVWAVMGTAPVLGDDVGAVAAVVASSAGLLEAIEPVAAAAGSTDLVAGGAPALASLVQDPATSAGLVLAHERAVAAAGLADRLSEQSLSPLVAGQVSAFGAQVEQVEPALATAASASRLLPVVLGSDEPRDVLVVVQTPAEVRSLGGLAGLALVVRAEDGVLEVLETYSGSSVEPVDPAPRSPELDPVYDLVGDRAGRYLVNATMVPDVPLASGLLAAAQVRRGGVEPDAVVLTDIGVLAGLLAVTGPVTTIDGTQLTAQNSDDLLQSGVYSMFPDPTNQDAFFADAAVAVMDRLLAPGVDARALMSALARDAAQGRVTLWSPDEATQADVVTAGLAGTWSSDPGEVGVFLNDGTGSKLQYFLRSEASVVPSDDAGGATVRLDLESTVPDPAALPDYVVGGYERLGLQRGTQRVQVLVYGPVGDGPSAVVVDGRATPVGSGVVAGRGVGVLSVDVAPGQVVRVEVELADGAGVRSSSLVTTPSVVVLP